MGDLIQSALILLIGSVLGSLTTSLLVVARIASLAARHDAAIEEIGRLQAELARREDR